MATKASRIVRRSGAGPERFLLYLALLVPLGVAVFALSQLPATGLASSSSLISADAAGGISSKRPVGSNPAPPPTLAPATATPKPTASPVPQASAAKATATPQKGGRYVVQPGDELKSIAADYNVSIWKIIDANDIPNPDSLKIGQVLHIPSE